MCRRVLVLVTLGVTMLVGCSREQPEQPTALPPVQAASPGPTATAPAPSTPAPSAPAAGTSAPSTSAPRTAAAQKSGSRDEELVAAATEWHEAVKRSYATLDSSELKALSHPDCRGCQQQIALVKDAAEQKHRYELGEFRITRIRILGEPTAEKGSVRLDYDGEGLVVRDAAGQVVREVPSESSAIQVDLVRANTGWQVRRLLGLVD